MTLYKLAPTAALVALAAIPGTSARAQTVAPQQAPIILDGAVLDVVAEGKTTRVPDLATIHAGVVTQAATAADAMAQNADRMARVIAALEAAGVEKRDIQTATISLSPQYRYGENQPPIITGYQASNRVSVRFRDVAESGAILDALVREGANQINGPSLSLAEPEAALNEARTDAVRRARARAELYAQAAGMSVDRILSISESAPQSGPIPPPVLMARMEAADASTQIAPGEQDVTVTLWVRFLLK